MDIGVAIVVGGDKSGVGVRDERRPFRTRKPLYYKSAPLDRLQSLDAVRMSEVIAPGDSV